MILSIQAILIAKPQIRSRQKNKKARTKTDASLQVEV